MTRRPADGTRRRDLLSQRVGQAPRTAARHAPMLAADARKSTVGLREIKSLLARGGQISTKLRRFPPFPRRLITV
jgi:hypothetical protein